MTILSLLLLQLLLERLQIPQKGLGKNKLEIGKNSSASRYIQGPVSGIPKVPPYGPLILGLVFHCPLDKIHSWKLFAFGKIFAHGKIKSRRKSLIKKKKEKSLRREKEYHSVKERKKILR